MATASERRLAVNSVLHHGLVLACRYVALVLSMGSQSLRIALRGTASYISIKRWKHAYTLGCSKCLSAHLRYGWAISLSGLTDPDAVIRPHNIVSSLFFHLEFKHLTKTTASFGIFHFQLWNIFTKWKAILGVDLALSTTCINSSCSMDLSFNVLSIFFFLTDIKIACVLLVRFLLAKGCGIHSLHIACLLKRKLRIFDPLLIGEIVGHFRTIIVLKHRVFNLC